MVQVANAIDTKCWKEDFDSENRVEESTQWTKKKNKNTK